MVQGNIYEELENKATAITTNNATMRAMNFSSITIFQYFFMQFSRYGVADLALETVEEIAFGFRFVFTGNQYVEISNTQTTNDNGIETDIVTLNWHMSTEVVQFPFIIDANLDFLTEKLGTDNMDVDTHIITQKQFVIPINQYVYTIRAFQSIGIDINRSLLLLNAKQGSITIQRIEGAFAQLATEKETSPNAESFLAKQSQINELEYKEIIDNYMNILYENMWDRFSSRKAGWLDSDGTYYASDDAIISTLLASRIDKSRYIWLLGAFTNLVETSEELFSYRVMPFLGKIPLFLPQIIQDVTVRKQKIMNAIHNNESTILFDVDTSVIMLATSSSQELKQYIDFIQNLRQSNIDPVSNVMILYHIYQLIDRGITISVVNEFEQILYSQLVYLFETSIDNFSTNRGLFVLYLSNVLQRMGQNMNLPILSSVGRGILFELLEGFDVTSGFITLSHTSTIIPIEYIYEQLLGESQWYPQFYPLLLDNTEQNNAWIYSLIPSFDVTATATDISIYFNNDNLQKHYIFIHHLPVLTLQYVSIFNHTLWPTDPLFDNFGKGSYYIDDTLIIKYDGESSGAIRVTY